MLSLAWPKQLRVTSITDGSLSTRNHQSQKLSQGADLQVYHGFAVGEKTAGCPVTKLQEGLRVSFMSSRKLNEAADCITDLRSRTQLLRPLTNNPYGADRVSEKEKRMHIGIHLSNHLVAEAVYQLLVKNGYDDVVTSESSPTSGFTPDVLLVDITTLRQDLLAQHPEAGFSSSIRA